MKTSTKKASLDCVVCAAPLANDREYRKHLFNEHRVTLPPPSIFERPPSPSEIFGKYLESYLNEQQREFVLAPPDRDRSLLAPPGSGKTTTFVSLFHYLMRVRGWSGDEIAAIIFSRDAAHDFRKRLKSTMGEKKQRSYNVSTFHSLAGSLLYQAVGRGRNVSSQSTVVAAAAKVLSEMSGPDEFSRRCPKYASLRLILLDEAQDVNEAQYCGLVAQLRRLTTAVVYMVGDVNQAVFSFRGGDPRFLQQHCAAPDHLVVNYRSTPEVVKLLNHFEVHRNDNSPRMVSARAPSGVLPRWINHASREGVLEWIVLEIRKHGPRDTAILGPFRHNNGRNGSASPFSVSLAAVYNRLEEEGIPCQALYRAAGADDGARIGKEIDRNVVTLMTLHGSKGLEWERVILVDFHWRTMKVVPSKKDELSNAYLWFVGLSRAGSHLSVHSLATSQPWPGMRGVPHDVYEFEGVPVDWNKVDAEMEKARSKEQQQEQQKIVWTITEFMRAREGLAEARRLSMETKVAFESGRREQLWESCGSTGYDGSLPDLCTMMGSVAHSVVETVYRWRFSQPTIECSFLQRVLASVRDGVILEVPRGHAEAWRVLEQALGDSLREGYTVGDLRQRARETSSVAVLRLVEALSAGRSPSTVVFLVKKLDLFWHVPDILEERCADVGALYGKSLDDEEALHRALRAVVFLELYKYQRENELPFLIEHKFEAVVAATLPLMQHLVEYVLRSPDGIFGEPGWNFEVSKSHPYLDLTGCVDAVDPHGVVHEFKFSSSEAADSSYENALQALLGYNLLRPGWGGKSCGVQRSVRVVNIRWGTSQEMLFDKSAHLVLLHQIVEVTGRRLKDGVCLLYDLETTGLDTKRDSIIERHFYEPTLELVVSSGLVRPDRLPLDPAIEELTGITSDALRQDGVDPSPARMRRELDEFTALCESVVLVAHNGNSFDHLLLRHQGFTRDDGKCLFLDSKSILTLMPPADPEVEDRGKLPLLYQRIVGTRWEGPTHRAEADVLIMEELLRRCGQLDEPRWLWSIAAERRN